MINRLRRAPWIAVVVLGIALIVLLRSSLYTVDEINHAVVEQFGEIKSVRSMPGLNFKVPLIQQVTKLDKRILTLDTPSQEYLTVDQKRILVDQVTRWKIVDPRRFFLSVRTESGGAARLRPLVEAELRGQIASNLYDVMISAERDEIMNTVKLGLQARVDEAGLGVLVTDVRTKRADLPEAVEERVYARMASARQVEADRHRAVGQRKADVITSETDRAVAIMIACANRVSQELRGDGEASAIRIFSDALQQDPEFFSFLRRLEAYSEVFQTKDKLLISTDSSFFQLLSGEVSPIPLVAATQGMVLPLSEEAVAPISDEEISALVNECSPNTD